MKKLFVYGSLMNSEVLFSLLNRTFTMKKAKLSGYQCLAVTGVCYPGVRPRKGGVVVGALISGLDQQHLNILDQFEGGQYQRVEVEVETDVGQYQRCETYAFKPEYYHLLTNIGWSNEDFREKHMQAFINGLSGFD